ncbi:PREDICTED: zinc finger protein 862-like [Priapulus caudatus]|uniref:Zinc finger protein 862-like n=1 Tax=Priapulus caudatus TaxID=37621 RepID=A0ABM1EAW2_PRICU|nr:PREDICTED: zinc finger protein 862-like [Priapulus caudatus]
MASIRVVTVEGWIKEIDQNREWIEYEESGGRINIIRCKMCVAHQSRLRSLRNFNQAFINGVKGSAALKKDSVVKHSRSEMHKKAIALTLNPKLTLDAIFKTTPIGKALAGASGEEEKRVSKLFDIAYTIAKEELPFTKYPVVIGLEKKHGVPLGNTYTHEAKCSEFIGVIGDTMKSEMLTALKEAKFYSIMCDGSTDASVTEKELVYVHFVNDKTGEVQSNFFCLSDVKHATAQGLKDGLDEVFTDVDMSVKGKLVCVCADGAAVNMGVKKGLIALLRNDEMPWLIGMHCLNHRLELASKNAFENTYMDEINSMLLSLYYVYEKSPKRLRELKTLGEVMEEAVTKPDKAHGTRWLQHKSRALASLLRSYPVIVAHLESMASESSAAADGARFRGYLKVLTSFKFVLHMLLFFVLLQPLAALSCNLQGELADLMFAMASLESFHASTANIDSVESEHEDTEDVSELSKFLSDITFEDGKAEVEFKNVKLTNVRIDVLTAFHNSRKTYVKKIRECVDTRFSDFTSQLFQAFKVLDTNTWPRDKPSLDQFGHKELSTVFEHFKGLLQEVQRESIQTEWNSFKSYWNSVLMDLQSSDVWRAFVKVSPTKYPNLGLLIRVLLTFPVSNAKVERGFSTMRRIKTDWRCRLNARTLDHLMRISIEGPPAVDFNPQCAVKEFFSTPRKPNVQPYQGSSKRQYPVDD